MALPSDNKDTLVLVTGGSGFIGGYCILALLKAGYKVRTTVRSLKREPTVRETLTKGGATNLDQLTFVEADLTSDSGWTEACAGCTYVLHVASPFPSSTPAHEDELIIPARDGTLRVLKAAKEAGVKRVVQTSSFAAIGYGFANTDQPMDETMWSDTTSPDCSPYSKSKTLAEKAAWKFIEEQQVVDGQAKMELAAVNPVAVLGPVLGSDYATSILLVKRLMNGEMPGLPKLTFGVVDVRDVADLHLLAMTSPAAAGERFLAVTPPSLSVREMALILKQEMGAKANKVATMEVPTPFVRIFALWDKEAKMILPELGKTRRMTNEKAKTVLGWSPRNANESLKATAESLIEEGLVKV